MDSVNQKFTNFKSFLVDIAPDVQEVNLFKALVPLDLFLETLHLRTVTNGKTIDQLVDRICTKVNVSRESFPPEIQQKFTRYISYFIDITREMQD